MSVHENTEPDSCQRMTRIEIEDFMRANERRQIHIKASNGYDSRAAGHRLHRFLRLDRSTPGKTYALFATLPGKQDVWTVKYDVTEIIHAAYGRTTY